MSVKDKLTGASRPERTVQLCLRGDLVAAYETAERELRAANEADADSFAGGAARDVAARMEALREQMREGTVVFCLRALPKMRPMSLVSEHPPREDNDTDRQLGYNQDTFYEAMIREACYEVRDDLSVVVAEDLSDADWADLFDKLSYRQFDALFEAAFALNNRDVDLPTSALASLVSQANGGSSRPPGPGVSARNGSRAGSRRPRPSSSTAQTVSSSAP